MKTITSKDNPVYKSACRLTRKKYRDDAGMYLIEGVKSLEDALQLGIGIRNIFIREDRAVPESFPAEKTSLMDRELFEKLSGTETSQGVIAVADKNITDISSFAGRMGNSNDNVVILDRLQDPGNAGTIIRTAEAAGYRAVIVMSGTADVYSPKVVRAAAGSLFRMQLFSSSDMNETVRILKASGKCIVSADLDTDVMYNGVDLSENIALVIGNEGQGVSRGFLEASDIKVRIPMEGSIESLNAAVAAGILMYQSHNKTECR